MIYDDDNEHLKNRESDPDESENAFEAEDLEIDDDLAFLDDEDDEDDELDTSNDIEEDDDL